MDVHANILNKIQVLEAIYRSGYQNDVIEHSLDKMIALEQSIAQKELSELQSDLTAFEKQYQMPSDIFYQRFHKGELGDDTDFFEWSAIYNMYQSVKKRLFSLDFVKV